MRQIPIYWINLASQPDRRAFMEEQFDRLGLAAHRIEAVTPSGINPDELRKYTDTHRYQWLLPGELACSLSHIKAMKELLESGAPHGAIFEDDAVMSPALPAFLETFSSNPPPFDLLKIETFDEPLRLRPGAEGKIGNIEIRRSYSWSAGSAGYIVSKRAAGDIVRCEEIRRTPVDQALFNPYEPLSRTISMRHIWPALCIQLDRVSEGGDSSISSARNARALASRPPIHKQAWHALRLGVDREVRIGALKAWHQFVGKAKKQKIPYSA